MVTVLHAAQTTEFARLVAIYDLKTGTRLSQIRMLATTSWRYSVGPHLIQFVTR